MVEYLAGRMVVQREHWKVLQMVAQKGNKKVAKLDKLLDARKAAVRAEQWESRQVVVKAV